MSERSAFFIGVSVATAFALGLWLWDAHKKTRAGKAQLSPAAGAAAPAGPAAASVPQPLPQKWDCPAEPKFWPRRMARREVFETEARWEEYLRISKFAPPRAVDFTRFRVAFMPFRGGGGVYRKGFEAARTGEGFVLSELVTTPTSSAVTADISYECALFVIPREAGPVALDTKDLTVLRYQRP